jgi:hypothetical protein
LAREGAVKALARPNIDYRAFYRQLTARTANPVERGLLEALEDRIVAASAAYDLAMNAETPGSIAKIALTEHEEYVASSLYSRRMVRKGSAGRSAYDSIRRSADRCPYCLDGEIWEVDHYLPQAGHPDVCAYPGNLVPICHPCNHLKRDLEPGAAGASLLHPYFDRLPPVRWLFARVEFTAGGPVLLYSAHLQPDHGNIAARLNFHFGRLELSDRFRPRAAKILLELQEVARDLFPATGRIGLQTHLRAEAGRLFARDGNTIEMAAYHAAADSDPFCAGVSIS